MPCRPRAPILGQRSSGNWFVRCISAARGAISFCEKACTVSRIASAVSPRSKLRSSALFVAIIPSDVSSGIKRSYVFLISSQVELDTLETSTIEYCNCYVFVSLIYGRLLVSISCLRPHSQRRHDADDRFPRPEDDRVDTQSGASAN